MKKALMKIVNRIKVNCKSILKSYRELIEFIFSALGLSIFFNINEEVPEKSDNTMIMLLILFLPLVIAVFYNFFKKKVTIKSASSKEFCVSYGDIFKHKATLKVIPFNCCFDTVVNDSLVSENTLHGQFINKYFKNNTEVLDGLIKESLRKNNYEYDSIKLEDKREGNRARYPFGSIAEVKYKDKIYYLLALNEFDKNINAHLDVEKYTTVINCLMTYYNKHSQGNDICIPLIGSGDMSRFNKGKQNILETLVALIKINDDKICGKVNVIVYNQDKYDVSIRNLL